MIRPILSACVVALLAAISPVAQAQSRFGGSGTSAFGSGFGSGGLGGSGFGSSGFGSSGIGGSGFGSSGFGGSGFGSSGFGGGGFGSSSFGMGGFGGSGIGGSSFGNQGFGAGGYGGGQNFVGRDAADMAVWNQMGQAGSQFFNQMNRNMSRGNRSDRRDQTVDNPPQVMRVNLQVAFDSQRPAPEVVVNNLRARLGNILASHNIAQPEVTNDGDVVVLRGVALTDSQRLVLEKLIALEPGVRTVRNEMTVIPQAAVEAVPEAGN